MMYFYTNTKVHYKLNKNRLSKYITSFGFTVGNSLKREKVQASLNLQTYVAIRTFLCA